MNFSCNNQGGSNRWDKASFNLNPILINFQFNIKLLFVLSTLKYIDV